MTLIDKAEAHDDDLIRRGDALAAVKAHDFRWEAADAIAAIPARGVGVKPLVDAVEALNAACDAMWNDHHRLELNPSLFGQEMRIKKKHVKAITEAQQRLPAILAALSPALAPTDAADELASVAAQIMADQKTMDLGVTEAQWQGLYETDPAPTDAAHVNETPKSEHDADNVLTAAQAREAAARLLLDMLNMRNGAHEGVSKKDVQKMWDAAGGRHGFAAVDAFLRSIIKEART